MSDYAHLETKVKRNNLIELFYDEIAADRYIALHPYGLGIKELVDFDFS